MRYRLLIFDFDGTLADSFPAFEAAFQQVVVHFKLPPVDATELQVLRGLGAREVIGRLGIPMWKVPRVAHFIRGLLAGAPPPRLFSGMGEVLRGLAESGMKLAAVSSNLEENVRAGLGPELASLFTTFACGASLFGKAAKFRTVLKRTSCAPHEALAIGDELRDAEAAQAVRLPFGAVAWGYTNLEAFRRVQPAEVFGGPGDLLRLVDGNEFVAKLAR